MSADVEHSPSDRLAAPSSSDEELAPRYEQLHALHSAWAVLAPASMSSHGEEIAETGRALTQHLTTLIKTKSDVTPAALDGIDTLLREFETSIRKAAESVPISQLRSTLPGCRRTNREGLLDLLDVLLGTPGEQASSVAQRIQTLDYLITLLCTKPESEPGVIGFDPVTLTPRLQELTERAGDPDDPLLADVEAEFFAASNLDTAGLREELQLRTLRNRKAELGMAFFAPRVLRAIVTYNSALVARVQDEILDSTDWGPIEAFEASGDSSPLSRSSVFESAPLYAVASSVRRRAAGEEPEPNASDRMAWALDFEYLTDNERKALCSDDLGTAEDPLGTAILIGLLSRSVAVLSIELQEAGLSPDEITDDWVDEISVVFQEQINRYISDDAYKVACALSELKNKFLLAPLADHLRVAKATDKSTRLPPPPAAAPRPEKTESARDLVMDALERDRDARSASTGSLRWEQIPWARIGQGLFAMSLVVALGFVILTHRNPDLDGMSTEELAWVSPYLVEGQRDGQGQGVSFVGEVDARWLELPHEQRAYAAEKIVSQLRSKGVRQIMIYDGNRQIRIQALGTQPTRTL